MAQLSSAQHRTLVAVAEAVLPAGRFLPAGGEATVNKVEGLLGSMPSALQRGLGGLLGALDARSWLGERKPFARASVARRLAMLEGWRTGDPLRRFLVRGLVSPLKMAHFDDPALYAQLGCVYETARGREAKPAYLRDRVHALDGDLAVECDVVVIGTGAGGAVVGRELVEAGLAVVFVEEGKYFDRSEFTGRALDMQQKLYRRGAATFALGNSFIPLPLGQTVGGSTTVNSGTCIRTPDRVLASWRDELGLAELAPDRLAPYFDRVESVLQVEAARADLLGGNGRVIARGCDALGFTHHGPLRRNAPACDGQGVCCFGCPTDAKRSTNVSYIPLALRGGAELFPGAKVTRIIVEAGRARGVVAHTEAGHALTVHARAVVVACGTIMTPLLLGRHQLGGASGQLGKNLSIHPAAGCLAEFDEQILTWRGIPQGYTIEDLHDEGILFEGATVPLEMSMTAMSLIGPDLIRLAESFDHVASFGFLVEDSSRGSVHDVMGQPMIRYWLQEQDVAHIKRAIDVLAQIFFAAGARVVHVPVAGFERLRPDDLPALRRAKIRAWDLDLSAYHPLGTARMGRDPASSVVDPDHKLHGLDALYVVDGSAVPTSLGVNPQVTIMALATRAAEKIAHALG
ncbi:MAG TPA: GMC family oxidoreductase [Kofleriaceae bacterium]|nr:GMC family oxidoreductase [Kofleriaceae bacterium]